MRFLLFAGQYYYPSGGARDCVGACEYADEAAAIEWAERFDTEGHVEWKHLARIDASGLTVVREWTRDYELVRVEGGHRREMGSWEVDNRDD